MNRNYIGIDFGTANCSVSVYNERAGQAEILMNAEGRHQTPSLVRYRDEGEPMVGASVEAEIEDASRSGDLDYQASIYSQTFMSVKTRLGASSADYVPGRGFLTASEMASDILKKLKGDAETRHFHREKVSRAVITCPASFDHAQRRAVEEAGGMAGFEEVELLEEPSAGAIAYAEQGHNVGRLVLVYDLGAGTFDLATLENHDGEFHVALEPTGLQRCAGDDFDHALYEYVDGLALKELGRPLSLSGQPDKQVLLDCRKRKENSRTAPASISATRSLRRTASRISGTRWTEARSML